MTHPIADLLQRYTDALRAAGATAPFREWSTFAPATPGELSALSAEVGVALPAELVAWFQALGHALPLVGNYSGLKIERVISDIQGTRTIDFSRHFQNISGWKDGRFDDGRLARTYWQPQWVPLAQDGCGNAYCYDLAPGPSGRVGQLVAMEFQDGQGPYLARWGTLEELVSDHLRLLQQALYDLDDEGFIEFRD